MSKTGIAFDNETTDVRHILRCIIYVKTYMRILTDAIDEDYKNYKEFVWIKPLCFKVCDYLRNEISKGLSKETNNVFIGVNIMDLLIFYEMAKGFVEATLEDLDDATGIEIVLKLGVDRPTLKTDLVYIDKKIDKLKALVEKFNEKD